VYIESSERRGPLQSREENQTMDTITRRDAVIVARRMRHQGYTRVRTVDLQGRTISDAAHYVAGASGDPRDVAETIIGIMKFSCHL